MKERLKKISDALALAGREMNALVEDLELGESTLPDPPPQADPRGSGKVGIVIGHGRANDKGAVSLGGVSEWDYNLAVAEKLHSMIEGSHLIKSTNIPSYNGHQAAVATELETSGCTCAIELHFNAAGDPTAHGHEWLYSEGSAKGENLAESFHMQMIADHPDLRDRGMKALRPGDNGHGFVSRNAFPKIICEPFFGTNQDEWVFWSQRKKELVRVYFLALCNAGYVELA